MAAVSVTSVSVLDNPTQITNPLQFEIQYECLFALEDDLEWKLTYVGSAESEAYDQVLDSVFVGPVVPGQYRFVFQADPPDYSRIPADDVVGVTVLLLTCSYKSKEFVRIGYYVNTDYADEALREERPDKPILDQLHRSILEDKPRVTKFPVEWDAPAGEGQENRGEGNGGPAAPANAAPAAPGYPGPEAGSAAYPPASGIAGAPGGYPYPLGSSAAAYFPGGKLPASLADPEASMDVDFR